MAKLTKVPFGGSVRAAFGSFEAGCDPVPPAKAFSVAKPLSQASDFR